MESFDYWTTFRYVPKHRQYVRAKVTFNENYFSITGEVYVPGGNAFGHERRVIRGVLCTLQACGRVDEEIAEAFPELAPLQRWHLCSLTEPLHYVANSWYWLTGYADRIAGEPWSKHSYYEEFDTPTLRKHFCSASLYGLLPEETDEFLDNELVATTKEEFEAWCAARLPTLLEQFNEALVLARDLRPSLQEPPA